LQRARQYKALSAVAAASTELERYAPSDGDLEETIRRDAKARLLARPSTTVPMAYERDFERLPEMMTNISH